MRLFKDIKVELKATMDVSIKYKAKCPCKFKKYSGLVKDELVQMPYKSTADFEKTLKFMQDLELIDESDDVNVIKEDIVDYDADWNKVSGEIIDRSNGRVLVEYKASYKYDINLMVYGRLYIGNGSNFEDCFETRSGIKLDDVINADVITKLIESKLPNEDFDKEVTVKYKYDDDVRLLPNDDELKEVIYANKDEIFDAISDDLHYTMYGNPEEE